MISTKIVEDSITAWGKRITTVELTYPRFIHSEVMTHRVFSRNAMSSRAVPVAKMLEQVKLNPVVPIHWGRNQPGMQAHSEVEDDAKERAVAIWMEAANAAYEKAKSLADLGVHKQIVNRLLEPFQWIKTIVTATEWDNFFELRDHEDAEPHFQRLARSIRGAMDSSTPTLRQKGAFSDVSTWHLPYVTEAERSEISFLQLLKASAARCARVSYLNHDGKAPSMEADIALYSRLIDSKPMHASPVEHQAMAGWRGMPASGNFIGWLQHRKVLEEGV